MFKNTWWWYINTIIDFLYLVHIPIFRTFRIMESTSVLRWNPTQLGPMIELVPITRAQNNSIPWTQLRRLSTWARTQSPVSLQYIVLDKNITVDNIKKKSTIVWSFYVCVCPTLVIFSLRSILGARVSVVGWGTMLQAGRSQDRVPMRWMLFSIYLIFPAALWPWGRLGL
jgi:hypothetical protein